MIRLINQVDTLQRLLEAVAAVPAGQRLHIPALRDALVNQADVLAGLQLLVAAGELDPATLRPPLLGEQQPLEKDLAELASPPASIEPAVPIEIREGMTGQQLLEILEAEGNRRGLSRCTVGFAAFNNNAQLYSLAKGTRPARRSTLDKAAAWLGVTVSTAKVSPAAVRVTGRQLAADLRNYAAEHKLSIRRVANHLFNGPNALGRLPSVASPRQATIDKVHALLAGPPPAALTHQPSGGPRVPKVGAETGAGLAAEVDQLIAREGLLITAVGLHLFGNRGGVQHLRRSNPRRATVVKVRAFLAAPPLDQLRPTLPPMPAPVAQPCAPSPPVRRPPPAAVPIPKAGLIIPARPPLPSPPPPFSPMVSKLKPAEVAWCDQCDQRVSGARVDKCQSRFCSLKKAAAA